MERDRVTLIQKTFRTLNSYYYRNQNMNSSSTVPPLAVQRVKVTFKDEPGEGSGVARSFYASIVEVSYPSKRENYSQSNPRPKILDPTGSTGDFIQFKKTSSH
jgi:hypothetical protein